MCIPYFSYQRTADCYNITLTAALSFFHGINMNFVPINQIAFATASYHEGILDTTSSIPRRFLAGGMPHYTDMLDIELNS